MFSTALPQAERRPSTSRGQAKAIGGRYRKMLAYGTFVLVAGTLLFEAKIAQTEQANLLAEARSHGEEMQIRLTNTLDIAKSHVHIMRQIVQTQLDNPELIDLGLAARIAAASTGSPEDSPWDNLRPGLRARVGSININPQIHLNQDAFQRNVAAVSSAIAQADGMHAYHKFFQRSHYYDAQRQWRLAYPAQSRKDLLQTTGTDNMSMAIDAMFDANGVRPLTAAGPANDPKRAEIWTAPYRDALGAGMMVTLLAPVYAGDRYAGVLCSDIALGILDTIVSQRPLSLGRAFVVDGSNAVLADSTGMIEQTSQIVHLSDLVPLAPVEQPDMPGATEVAVAGATWLQFPVEGTNWKLLVQIPDAELRALLVKRLAPTLALSLGALLFIFSLGAIQNRRYVLPALLLADYFDRMNASSNPIKPKVPALWQHSFDQVQRIATEHEKIKAEMTAKNQIYAKGLSSTSLLLKLTAKSIDNLRRIYDGATMEAMKICNANCISIFLIQDGAIRLASSSPPHSHKAHAFSRAFPATIPRHSLCANLRAGDVLQFDLANDISFANDPILEKLHTAGSARLLLLPLSHEEEVAGMLCAMKPLGQLFTDDEIGLMSLLCDQVMIAMRMSHLFLGMQSAQQEAENATRAKSDFLANMSHEIRTPMNAIIGLSGLAMKNTVSPRVHDYLVKIRNSGEHLLGIINDVLDLSKIEAGKLEIEHVPFELESVIDNVVNLIGQKADLKGLELLCSVDRDVPGKLVGDPLRLGQILVNYATNAVKFTHKGQVHIHVHTSSQTETDVVLRFEVSDTGIGLSEEQKRKLFQSFSQTDSSITREYGGTGLGLVISKRLAESMDGEVGVSSTLGNGSTFWLSVRLGVIANETRNQERLAIDLRGKRVLVVDDNKESAHILRDLLKEVGFSVHSAYSGEAALQLLKAATEKQRPFDFVLMDWLMPGMDGLETIRAIRALRIPQSPFILMVTAHRRQELVRSAELLGVEYVLAKPVSGSTLVDTMMQILGQPMPDFSARRSDAFQLGQELESRLQEVCGARILLVEDNALNQQVATELLRDAGFEVNVAVDGRDAVDQVERGLSDHSPYDLVLMDMQMPVMDGVTAAQHIRQKHAASELPIVAMTASAMQADRDRCLAAGMNDFVTKPILPAQLWQSLLRWIRPREGLGQAHRPALPTMQEGFAPQFESQLRVTGLDMERGIALMGQNRTLYFNTLRTFAATQGGVMDEIRHALEVGEVVLAERLVHTLKAQAGYLGAPELQGTAADLESLLGTGYVDPEKIQAVVRAMEQQLSAIIASVTQAFPPVLKEAAADDSQTVLPQEQTVALLQEMEHLVLSNDPHAQDILERNRHTLKAALGASFDALELALQGFDFETAAKLLQNR